MSGGGSTTTNTQSKFEPPEWAASKFPEYLDRAYEISNVYGTNPGLVYGNSANQPLVAQMSDLQNKAANGIYGMASQGNPNENLANGYLANLLNGGQQNIQPQNPYLGATSSYGGASPQFQNMVNASNQQITDNFLRGTQASQNASAAQAGAYGGSADQQLKGVLAGQLSGQIAQNTNNLYNDQYNRSAALEQQDIARNSGLAQNQIQNAWQGYENAANRGLSGIGLVNQLGNTDFQRWLGVMGAGDLQRQVQSENISAAKDLFNRNVQLPLQGLDILGSALGLSSGLGTRTTSESAPSVNPWMTGAGGLMALASMFGGGH